MATSNVTKERPVVVTSCLLQAFMACPTKCYLLYAGEIPAGGEYTNWVIARRESYRQAAILNLTAHASKASIASLELGLSKDAPWQFAVEKIVSAQGWEAGIAMIQRIPHEGAASQFIPISFVAANKLSASDKTMAAYEAIALAKALGTKVGGSKIVHGDKRATFSIKASTFSRDVHRKVSQVFALLSAASPPELILNRHCPECGFQGRCRKNAVEKDDLSLLSRLTDKDRARFRSKGIFTVSQLAYTFRPRRRSKRLASRPERYHHALKALAIREHKTHIVGTAKLGMEGTPIFLDVEGLPDRDFYYLIGVRVEEPGRTIHHVLWADSEADEKRIWDEFIDIVSDSDHPILFHYGSFEKAFLRKMCDRHGGPPEHSVARVAITSATNLLAVTYAQIYFPTYSNGLKEIARFLGFEWSDPSASGLLSIVWRSRWEESQDTGLRDRLIAYNANDCEALSLVTHFIVRILSRAVSGNEPGSDSEVVRAEELGKNILSKWRAFKSPLPDMEQINEAAYWNYQRDRVFVRTGTEARPSPKRPRRTSRCQRKAEKIVVAKAPVSCPVCGKLGRIKSRHLTRTVEDLVFGRDSVKRRVVKYVFHAYRCRSCGHEYGLDEWYLYARKWGWNVTAFFVYHIVGLRVPQLTMQRSLSRLFGFNLVRSTLNNLKIKAADRYSFAKRKILERIVSGKLVHADETRANIKGHLAYVWVLTNMTEVAYVLAESREGEIVQTLLKDFKGVLVSDFYAAYESIPCPQQKCLIHLMRDLNDEILNNPFDGEMKSIATGFAELLKPMVETVDRYGLKARFLRKHHTAVDRFFRFLGASEFKSEAALKCKQRFEKNRDTLFTFLHYDGVPWNNNNAEHAIKAFARLRDIIAGTSSRKGVDEYLTLLSVAETCEYRGIDFLDFLRSGERDVYAYANGCRKRIR
jgi:predicted RecB family nuclease